jgi:hypothetical protein
MKQVIMTSEGSAFNNGMDGRSYSNRNNGIENKLKDYESTANGRNTNRFTNVLGGFTTNSGKDRNEENKTDKKCSNNESCALNKDEESFNLNN